MYKSLRPSQLTDIAFLVFTVREERGAIVRRDQHDAILTRASETRQVKNKKPLQLTVIFYLCSLQLAVTVTFFRIIRTRVDDLLIVLTVNATFVFAQGLLKLTVTLLAL
jgi:hypothetical protein